MAAGPSWIDRVSRVLSTSLSEINPFRGEEPYVAVDIGSSTIKLLEVRGTRGEVRVQALATVATPPTAVQNNMVVESDQVAELIRAAHAQYGFRGKKAITAVPGPAVIIKRFPMAAQSEKEMEAAVLLEAGNFIPEELDNVNLDYQVTDYGEGDRANVLIVAAKKDIVQSYSETLRLAGLLPVVVDVDYFALGNMFELSYEVPPTGTVALVNIGARYSAINIIKNAQCAFTHDVAVGGRDITESLVQDLGVSFEAAEALKTGKTMDHELAEHAQAVIEAAAAAVVDEIHHALTFFWMSSGDETIDHIFLSGGGAQLPGMAAQLAERMGVAVEVANPFGHLVLGENVDREAALRRAAEFSVAVGLATRRPNDK
ncbi:MAG: pilus assembly protein PilM [Candidatus Binatia bacterium]|nr:pilus assembly protein PilM [Candidatus Binatia bacterium]